MAFMTAFQIMSPENWNEILYALLAEKVLKKKKIVFYKKYFYSLN